MWLLPFLLTSLLFLFLALLLRLKLLVLYWERLMSIDTSSYPWSYMKYFWLLPIFYDVSCEFVMYSLFYAEAFSIIKWSNAFSASIESINVIHPSFFDAMHCIYWFVCVNTLRISRETQIHHGEWSGYAVGSNLSAFADDFCICVPWSCWSVVFFCVVCPYLVQCQGVVGLIKWA